MRHLLYAALMLGIGVAFTLGAAVTLEMRAADKKAPDDGEPFITTISTVSASRPLEHAKRCDSCLALPQGVSFGSQRQQPGSPSEKRF